ncbi:MAG TPA: NAD-dependent epimerase/dehydratase family protein [Chloroflexota bacterium]|jgi:nucleoside-diphosphate-sugar epimerase
MSTAQELHVVLGARGGVGQAVVRLLAEQGKLVRAVSRGKAEALVGGEPVAADLLQRDQADAVCQGASVVYHCAGVPYNIWATALPTMLENTIAGASAAGARLVYADNCYMYAPTAQPMTEDLPYAPVTRKGRLRQQLAEALIAAHTQGQVRAVIGRATDFYGPGVVTSTIGERFFTALLAGKRVEWLGKLDQPHAMTVVDDFARVLITLGSREEALGQVWHVPTAEALTGRQYIALAADIAGVMARPMAVSAMLLRLVGLFNPLLRELGEMRYEFDAPYLIDGSKYLRAFGGTPTPHDEGIRRTVTWYRGRVPSPARVA